MFQWLCKDGCEIFSKTQLFIYAYTGHTYKPSWLKRILFTHTLHSFLNDGHFSRVTKHLTSLKNAEEYLYYISTPTFKHDQRPCMPCSALCELDHDLKTWDERKALRFDTWIRAHTHLTWLQSVWCIVKSVPFYEIYTNDPQYSSHSKKVHVNNISGVTRQSCSYSYVNVPRLNIWIQIDTTPKTHSRWIVSPHDSVPLSINHTCRFTVTRFKHLTFDLMLLASIERFSKKVNSSRVSCLLTRDGTLTPQLYPWYRQDRSEIV